MQVNSKDTASKLSRGDGLVCHVMHSERDVSDTELTATWVEVEPGARQKMHSHEPEQVYIVVRGEAVMTVDGDEQGVGEGDLVHVPPYAEHGIRNTGNGTLEYISAATPAFPMDEVEEFYDE